MPKRESKSKGKTHVFPYKAIEPIVRVDSKGNVFVTPIKADKSRVDSIKVDNDAIVRKLDVVDVKGSMRRFEDKIGDVHDEIREQTRIVVDAISRVRLDGDYGPLLREIGEIRSRQSDIMERLNGYVSSNSGDAQIEQGFRVLVDEMKMYVKYVRKFETIGGDIERLREISERFSELVNRFTLENRDAGVMDTLRDLYSEMKGVLEGLREHGVRTDDQLKVLEEGMLNLRETVVSKLDTMEDMNREIMREISEFSSCSLILEEIKKIGNVGDDRLERLSREISLIPRIDEGELLSSVREVIRELGRGDSGTFDSRLVALEGSLTSQMNALRDMKKVLELHVERTNEMQRALNVNSRLSVIEEGLKVLTDRDTLDEGRIMRAIDKLKGEVDFKPLLDRLDNMEKTLAGRDELRRGFEQLQRAVISEGVKLSGIESGMNSLRTVTEDSFERQLDILSRIEMKLSNEDNSDRVIEYQRQIRQCEEEKAEFEKKIGSLTMQLETLLRGKGDKADEMAATEMRNKKLSNEVDKLTRELEEVRSRNLELERDLQTSRRDKDIIDPRISDLESEIERLKGEDSGKVTELQDELSQLRARLKMIDDLGSEKTRLEREMDELTREKRELERQLGSGERELESLRADSEEYRRRIDELVSELKTAKDKVRTYEEEHLQYISLLGKIDELILKNEIFTDKVDYVERLDDLMREMIRRVEESRADKGEESREVIVTDIPRYAVYPSIDKIISLLRDPSSDPSVVSSGFSVSKDEAERRLLNYYQQMELTRKGVKDTLIGSVFLHRLRNLVLANPKFVREIEGKETGTNPVVGTQVEDLSARPLDLGSTGVGKFVLANGFSPPLRISPEANRLEEVAPRVASVLYRIFYINKVLDVVTTLDGRPRNIAFENELKEDLSSVGVWSEDRSQIMFEIEDLYVGVIKVLSNIRSYIRNLKYISEDYAYGLEMRYVVLDSFMKAFEESRIELEKISSIYSGRETLPEPSTPAIFSYIKIRGDNDDIDPRFTMKVDDTRRKIIFGHQPYVFSSSFAGDVQDPGQYQNDLIGPVSRVFTPSDTNEDIGNNVDEMVSELDEGRDICALALGPSGAGKTSTLLYFRGNPDRNISPQNGAIPIMLSKLSRDYVSAGVKAIEMSSSYIKGAGPASYWKEYEVFPGVVNFSRSSDGGWVSSGNVTIDVSNFDLKVGGRGVCEVSTPLEKLSSSNRVSMEYGKISLSDFLSKLIDLRLNCGTPNNPDSSRTHLFLFVQLKNASGNKTPYLIISDLAGREKSFDCDSEAILEVFATNQRYPELNSIYENPVKGGLRKSTKRDIPTGEQLKDKTVERSFLGTLNSFSEVTRENLESAINDGYMKVFFGKPLEWYYGPVAASGRRGLNEPLYRYLQTVSQFIVQDDYFFKKIMQRYDMADRQPLAMQRIFERIGGADKLRVYDGILKYYSGMNYQDPNLTAQTPGERLRLRVKGITEIDNAQNEHRGVVDYLNLVILVNAIDLMIFGRPKAVCGVRNLEGSFINQSLDEYSRLVTTASSIDANYGPLVHPECLPVVCKFAGLDCLLPKNIPKDVPVSAVSRVLSMGMGTPSFRPGTRFAIFLVVNASRTQPDKTPRPLYDPMDVLIDRVLSSSRDIERRSFYVFSQNENMLSVLSDIYMWFTSMDEGRGLGIMGYYERERRVLEEYRARVNYRGTDESKMLRREDIGRLYEASKANWDTIKRRFESILAKLSDPRFPSMDSVSRGRFTEIINAMRGVRDDVNKRNQDTIPGSLMFVDDLVKRGMQPMVCSTSKEEDILPPTSLSSWKDVLYRER